MSSNIQYSVGQYEGSILARATIKSFNLDHVTDKDITSYYRQISSQALFDTGLLPLNGTGILAIRSAGRHTQIAFQHAPQISYVNWGSHEGDVNAKAYMLAQPYRIWIADLLDGNLYGARMFYSPFPISTPDSVLYHLNLPNTNCKGYKGNGVGWICLYHNEDWSNLSFNVKIQKLIERCSGVEAYNDANMSETDGPRFYKEHNKPEYTWSPQVWQEKSLNEGFEWTLNDELWIPVLVKDIDNQDRHYDDGQPLTFAMALLGTYNSYYYDSNHPKLVNAFARQDIEIPISQVFDIFKKSHVNAKSAPEYFDQFNASLLEKTKIATSPSSNKNISLFDEEIDSNSYVCVSCEECYNEDQVEANVYNGEIYCSDCFNESFTYCENTSEFLHNDDSDLLFIPHEEIYIDSSQAVIYECENCYTPYWHSKNLETTPYIPIYNFIEEDSKAEKQLCNICIDKDIFYVLNLNSDDDDNLDSSLESGYCPSCGLQTYSGHSQLYQYFVPVNQLDITLNPIGDPVVNSMNLSPVSFEYTEDFSNFDFDQFKFKKSHIFCKQHALAAHYCPSGLWTTSNLIPIDPWVSPPIHTKSNPNIRLQIMVKELCAVSLNKKYDSEVHKHPFSHDLIYLRAMASVYNELLPSFSSAFTLYTEDGKEYTPELF